MSQPFKLKNPIGEAYSMGAEDTLNTKKALATLGHMETPDYGLDEYPDLPMIDAVKSFQRGQRPGRGRRHETRWANTGAA